MYSTFGITASISTLSWKCCHVWRGMWVECWVGTCCGDSGDVRAGKHDGVKDAVSMTIAPQPNTCTTLQLTCCCGCRAMLLGGIVSEMWGGWWGWCGWYVGLHFLNSGTTAQQHTMVLRVLWCLEGCVS